MPKTPVAEQTQRQLEEIQERQRKYLKDNPNEERKLELLKEIAEIAHQYGGLESNIPISNNYWTLLNQYRSL